MIRYDHVQIGALDAPATADFLADLLGTGAPVPEGQDDDMFRIDFDEGEFLLVSPAAVPVAFAHVAFRVEETRFNEIVGRLRARGVPFGNHHEDVTNGETLDPLGGSGRVYFVDVNGHLWEVAC